MIGGKGNANWKSQQVFALDFDCGVDPAAMIARSCINDLKPNIWYTTFSDTPNHRKFRIVYIFDKPLYSRVQAEHLLRYLHHLFPEADKAAKDLSRKFFGGKEAMSKPHLFTESAQ